VLIYAADPGPPQRPWARATIADALAAQGAAINAVSLAEIYVGEPNPESAADLIRSWGVQILDAPAAAASVCASAYVTYRERRAEQSGKGSPRMPLPDFFIGAHAQVMEWAVATADPARFNTYFPSVTLETP
jgi:predicted nucleic acid-binding protein